MSRCAFGVFYYTLQPLPLIMTEVVEIPVIIPVIDYQESETRLLREQMIQRIKIAHARGNFPLVCPCEGFHRDGSLDFENPFLARLA
jgi:hypothetical protein